jgi:chaperonin cofactor prefoldin
MVQASLILLLIVVILLFLFTLKVHFLTKDLIEKLEEIEVKLLKMENKLSSVEEKEAYLESNLRMAISKISKLGGEE